MPYLYGERCFGWTLTIALMCPEIPLYYLLVVTVDIAVVYSVELVVGLVAEILPVELKAAAGSLVVGLDFVRPVG